MGLTTQLMLQNPETLVTSICPSRSIPPAISRNSADTGYAVMIQIHIDAESAGSRDLKYSIVTI